MDGISRRKMLTLSAGAVAGIQGVNVVGARTDRTVNNRTAGRSPSASVRWNKTYAAGGDVDEAWINDGIAVSDGPSTGSGLTETAGDGDDARGTAGDSDATAGTSTESVSQPGFGLVTALAAIGVGGGYLARKMKK